MEKLIDHFISYNREIKQLFITEEEIDLRSKLTNPDITETSSRIKTHHKNLLLKDKAYLRCQIYARRQNIFIMLEHIKLCSKHDYKCTRGCSFCNHRKEKVAAYDNFEKRAALEGLHIQNVSVETSNSSNDSRDYSHWDDTTMNLSGRSNDSNKSYRVDKFPTTQTDITDYFRPNKLRSTKIPNNMANNTKESNY